MCNIAGYVGIREAAPVLYQMIRAQEGLNGGFYSGLAVHDGEALHYCKTMGDLETLWRETDAAGLSGNMGIAHSRTPSGGDRAWAHPFVTERGGDVKFCYVANGNFGLYKDRKEPYCAIADSLEDSGFEIPCKLKLQDHSYCRLSGGDAVHMSDVMCQLIYRYKTEGLDTAEAMTRAFAQMPSEIVGLGIAKESADRIFFSRINKPMFLGFDESGAYLASSPTAFPEGVKEYRLLPALSSGAVYRDRYEVARYPDFPETVRGFNRKTVDIAAAAILKLLESGEKSAREMMSAVRARMPKNRMNQAAAIVYLAIHGLLKSGRICLRPSQRTVGGQTAPLTLFRVASAEECDYQR